MTFMVPNIEEERCFICNEADPQFEATLTTRVIIHIIANVYVDPGTKVCLAHVDTDTQMIKDFDSVDDLETSEQIVRLTPKEIQEWMDETRQVALFYKKRELLMEDYMQHMKPDDLRNMYGISKEDFNDLHSHIPRSQT